MWKTVILFLLFIIAYCNIVAADNGQCPAYYNSRLIEIPVQISFEKGTELGTSYYRYFEPSLLVKNESINPFITKKNGDTIFSIFCIREPAVSAINNEVTINMGPRKLRYELPKDSIAPLSLPNNQDETKFRNLTKILDTIKIFKQPKPDWIVPIDVFSINSANQSTIKIKIASPNSQSIEGNPMTLRIVGNESTCRAASLTLNDDQLEWIGLRTSVAFNDEIAKIYEAKYSPTDPCRSPSILKMRLGSVKVEPKNKMTDMSIQISLTEETLRSIKGSYILSNIGFFENLLFPYDLRSIEFGNTNIYPKQINIYEMKR